VIKQKIAGEAIEKKLSVFMDIIFVSSNTYFMQLFDYVNLLWWYKFRECKIREPSFSRALNFAILCQFAKSAKMSTNEEVPTKIDT